MSSFRKQSLRTSVPTFDAFNLLKIITIYHLSSEFCQVSMLIYSNVLLYNYTVHHSDHKIDCLLKLTNAILTLWVPMGSIMTPQERIKFAVRFHAFKCELRHVECANT